MRKISNPRKDDAWDRLSENPGKTWDFQSRGFFRQFSGNSTTAWPVTYVHYTPCIHVDNARSNMTWDLRRMNLTLCHTHKILKKLWCRYFEYTFSTTRKEDIYQQYTRIFISLYWSVSWEHIAWFIAGQQWMNGETMRIWIMVKFVVYFVWRSKSRPFALNQIVIM